jgi:hypothetical protein
MVKYIEEPFTQRNQIDQDIRSEQVLPIFCTSSKKGGIDIG